MAEKTGIEWTKSTWNPVTGCDKVSPGCKFCYAETFAERFRGVKGHPYEQGFDLKLWPERLDLPLRWKKGRMIFVNSMSDLFHKDVPFEFVARVWDTMFDASQHTFQILTKRADRLFDFAVWMKKHGRRIDYPNIWLGVSAENQQYAEERIHLLLATPASIHWISAEPLLGEIDLRPIHEEAGLLLDWVVVGGESGPGARPMNPEWVRSLRDQSLEAQIPFFFKQWGGVHKKKNGKILDGQIWNQFPSPERK